MSLKWRRATIDFVLLIILGCGLTHPLQLVKAQEPSNNQNQVADEQTDNFDIKLHSYYRVNANSHTSVEHHFTISNNTPEFFISKYGIIVSSTNLDQITITDDGQTLAAHVSHLPGQTSIGVTFDRNLVGEDKSRELIISYIDQDIAQISGQILELNIPALANPDQYQDYQLDLVVPNIFGTASRIKPETFTLSQSNDFDTYRYQNLAGQAVSAIFGDNQVFDLKLNYILNNPSNQTSLNQITLPPETSKQKVHYHQLDPLPENIKIDEDGNFIATYAIPANNSVTVELLAQVLLTLNDNPLSPTAPVLPEHLQAQKYWELNNERLQSTAASLSGALDINNFVVNTLDYTQADLDQEFTRLGAAAALVSNNLDQATCQEFTDLFIALARLKGIPAKRLVGYVVTRNSNQLALLAIFFMLGQLIMMN